MLCVYLIFKFFGSPRKSADVAPNPPAAAAICPRCNPGCWRTGLCGDVGLGLGARILSMVNNELAVVVVTPRLNTGLNPSPKKTFPRSWWCLGCAVSTILNSSSAYVSSGKSAVAAAAAAAASHHSKSLSRLIAASFGSEVSNAKTNHHWYEWYTRNTRSRRRNASRSRIGKREANDGAPLREPLRPIVTWGGRRGAKMGLLVIGAYLLIIRGIWDGLGRDFRWKAFYLTQPMGNRGHTGFGDYEY